MLAAIALLLVATQLRAIVEALWLGAVVDIGLGARAFVSVLEPLGVPLAVLVVAAGAIFAAAGPRRELGRSFDLACVAVVPIVVVVLVVMVVGFALDLAMPSAAAAIAAYGWTGVLVVLAISEARRGAAPSRAHHVVVAGGALTLLACVGIAVQAAWVVRHLESVRPLTTGEPAPAFALPTIGPNGVLGAKVALAPGKITVIDFWATWCGPCLRALPQLDAFARHHPEVDVLAILVHDDAAGGRALFDERGYTPLLLADDDELSKRYAVLAIPHTVVIDAEGRVRRVSRGGELDLERELAALRQR